ncbi:hypothetical protein BLS_009485 [Venturia inaequalis]|uniref:Heterokaryon incompatibility domain-containing protein n=1 Tax=Venturia inaequalis TaxID=5025 RepID=A0A8H3U4G0_VENIN|nr:hypothetical protein BLS_009485 [Venturia inaequalis]RDI78345.1 hypothetical protein Vi05172_g11732 [Venturia inaequalis]
MDSSTSSELYKYTTLQFREIRLLRIQPDSQPGDIRFEIQVYGIDTCPPYIALSYTWGDSGNEKNVTLQGKQFLNRHNLACFLDTEVLKRDQGVEHHVEDLFWIDQISIDQSNDKERGHQVGMMRQIYSGADLVLAWVGEAADDSDLAMEMLQGDLSIWKEFNDSERRAISAFAHRSYWSRIWIIQEVVLANKLTILCGPRSLESTTIQIWNVEYSAVILAVMPTRMIDVLGLRVKTRKRTLLDLLLYSYSHRASEPKDKVFGLLGLATKEDGTIPDYVIDYSQSKEEILDSVGEAFRGPDDEDANRSLAMNLAHTLRLKIKLDLDGRRLRNREDRAGNQVARHVDISVPQQIRQTNQDIKSIVPCSPQEPDSQIR